MTALISKIGFGCARLRGGMEEANSRKVLDAALAGGIRYFDTAPSYGNGESEAIVGRALQSFRDEVRVCTKVGSKVGTVSARARLRSGAVAAVRRAVPAALLAKLRGRRSAPKGAPTTARGYGDFDLGALRASAERSFEQLRTERLDCLMLHEPRLSDPAPEVAGWLNELMREGRVNALGVGTFAQIDELPAFGQVAQFAVGPCLSGATDPRTLVGHGLLRSFKRTAFDRMMADLGVYASAPALRTVAAKAPGDAALLLNLVMRGTPLARILVSSNSASGLARFMAAAQDCDQELRAQEHAPWSGRCASAVAGYLHAAREPA